MTTTITGKRKVIIDTDAGCDDAVAILMALRDPTIDILAFTTVFGNVKKDQATENIYTILRVFDRLDIPFYGGASQPLVMDYSINTWPGHGANGLGDASFLEGGEHHNHEEYMKQVNQHVRKEHAVQALIELSKKYEGEIDLIALGPLTNLALGVRMDPLLASRFRSLTVMGGSVFGKGNSSMSAEFNFHCDPEAAYVTFQHFPSTSRPLVVVPWETTQSYALTWSEYDSLCHGHEDHVSSDPNTKHLLEASFLKKTHAKYELVARADFKKPHKDDVVERSPKRSKSSSLASVTERSLTADQVNALNELPSMVELKAASSASTASGSPTSEIGALTKSDRAPTHEAEDEGGHVSEYICCDAYAVAAYLRPDLITSQVSHYGEIQLQGSSDVRGMLSIDWYNRKPPAFESKRIEIVTGIDRNKFFDIMKQIFQPHQQNGDTPAKVKGATRKRNH